MLVFYDVFYTSQSEFLYRSREIHVVDLLKLVYKQLPDDKRTFLRATHVIEMTRTTDHDILSFDVDHINENQMIRQSRNIRIQVI